MRRIEFTIQTQNSAGREAGGGPGWAKSRRAGRFLAKATSLLALVLMASWNNFTAAQCALVCNDDVNVSLPGTNNDCELLITVDMVLEDPGSCPNPLEVSIMNLQGTPFDDPTVDETHIGQSLLYSVTETTSGNSCWGTIMVEDKLGPDYAGCVDVILPCIADSDPTSVGGEAASPTFDDCVGIQSVDFTDVVSNEGCNNLSAFILRTWTAVDINGYVSNCTQQISVMRVGLDVYTPECPMNVEMECASQMPNTDPSVTGYPTIEIGGTDYPAIPGANNFCTLASSYTDETFDICGGGQKILRTWNIYDWCLPTDPQAGNPFTCIQVIKIHDTTAPTISCPSPVVHDAASNGCSASLTLPPANVFDACSGWDVKILTPFGIVNGNGGLLLNADIGTHTITYVAEDECGNISTCQTTLTIEDNTPPVAICDEHTTVALSADGTAIVTASVFDDGSTDNCEVEYFSVRRMPSICQPGTPFGEFVTFECCDVTDANIMVAMRVYDYAGNFNECMIDVEVQDKIAPEVTCPPNKTIQCDEPIPAVQAPTIVDNCPGATWTVMEINQINDCGVGTIVRNYTAVDVGGLGNICTQVIFVNNSTPFGINDIVWPSNYTTDVCGTDLASANLPLGFDRPTISEDACDNVIVTSTDQLLPINPPACYKILRKWIVVDWCQYDPNQANSPGYWEYTQVLKVDDNDAPVLTCPGNQLVESEDPNCLAAFANVPPVGVDDCSENFDFDTRIDYFNNNTTDVVLSTPDASGSYPFGVHAVSVEVADGCGNAATCNFFVTVVDAKKPTPVCVNGLAVELMPDNVNGGGMINLTADMFDAGSFDNCTDADDLTLDISPSFFDCDDVGSNVVFIYVTDEAGNSDFCETYVIIQDNMVICPSPLTADVSGAITTNSGEGMSGVMIDVSGTGPSTAAVTSDVNGQFMFSNLSLGYDYSYTPNYEGNPLNGVTTYDIVLMTKHILNITPFDSPYKYIAADVNNNGSVTTADVVETRKMILQINTEFPNNTPWRFIDAQQVFSDPNNPWSTAFNEFYNINDLSADMMDMDFVAVKTGDVNGTASPNLTGNGTDDRSLNDELTFVVDDKAVLAGETFRIAFRANNFIDLVGFQFALHFDKDAVQLEDIETGDLTAITKANFGLALLEEGLITTSWDNTKNTLYDNNTVLFSLVFKANTNTSINEILDLAPNTVRPEAYQAKGENGMDFLNIGLDIKTDTELEKGFELYQNKPNPFRENTLIGFNLPEAGKATLTVYDLSGKVLKVLTQDFAEGYHEIELGHAELGTSGVLFYKLETPSHTATRRMVRL